MAGYGRIWQGMTGFSMVEQNMRKYEQVDCLHKAEIFCGLENNMVWKDMAGYFNIYSYTVFYI